MLPSTLLLEVTTMSHRVAHYNVFFNSTHMGSFEFATRADLVQFIRQQLAALQLPAAAIKQVRVRDVWRRIAMHGSSVQHFRIEARDNRLQFDGMTEGEYRDATSDE